LEQFREADCDQAYKIKQERILEAFA
jgi:hypothetical protein